MSVERDPSVHFPQGLAGLVPSGAKAVHFDRTFLLVAETLQASRPKAAEHGIGVDENGDPIGNVIHHDYW